MDLDGRRGVEELGVKEGKTIIRLYFRRKESVFNKRKTMKNRMVISKIKMVQQAQRVAYLSLFIK